MGPEYQRRRLLLAADLLRRAKIGTAQDLALSYWVERREHVLEILNLETGNTARTKFTSPLDVPNYAEIVEAIMVRRRV